MYNLLLDRLPQYTPGGLKIRTNFKESIKFELLMQDNRLNEREKIQLALNLYYKEIKDVETAVNDMIWFYTGEKNSINKEKNNNNESDNIKQIYSYEFDDQYIYSAFKEQYNIDLNSIKYLHWWKFKALMSSLNENTQFVKIMGYRALDLSKIKDKEEKARYKKLKKLYALPDMRTQEEKEADFGRAFWQK